MLRERQGCGSAINCCVCQLPVFSNRAAAFLLADTPPLTLKIERLYRAALLLLKPYSPSINFADIPSALRIWTSFFCKHASHSTLPVNALRVSTNRPRLLTVCKSLTIWNACERMIMFIVSVQGWRLRIRRRVRNLESGADKHVPMCLMSPFLYHRRFLIMVFLKNGSYQLRKIVCDKHSRG